ncbi:MAG TPA: hypothetical protein VK046_11945, partial [Actinomycetaceae bacterium]|nr:hypothetical protein [Actinomycetaceae bacterium]
MSTLTSAGESTPGASGAGEPPWPKGGPGRRPRLRRPRLSVQTRGRLGRLDVKVSPYLYITPFFVVFAIAGLFPILYTAYVSLH